MPLSLLAEITKQTETGWVANLMPANRSQIMFMDREDILNLYIVSNLPLPNAALDSDEVALGRRYSFLILARPFKKWNYQLTERLRRWAGDLQ